MDYLKKSPGNMLGFVTSLGLWGSLRNQSNPIMKSITTILFAGLLAIGSASAQSVDEFENGSNPNGWEWFGFAPSMPTVGGNPGGWLHDSFINELIPILRSSSAMGDWAGDYQAKGVSSIEFDTQCLSGPSGSQPMTILLRDTKGTPAFSDDDYVYFIDYSVVMPAAGAGWTHYSFDIPSQATTLPVGWSAANGDFFSPGFTAGYDWLDLIQNVDQVEVWMNDPLIFGIWLVWDMGVDNMQINSGPRLSASGLVGGGTATFTVTNATPFGGVLLGLSTTGAGPTATPFGSVAMSAPIRRLPAMTADVSGASSVNVAVPAGASGATIYMQGVDMASAILTNALVEMVL